MALLRKTWDRLPALQGMLVVCIVLLWCVPGVSACDGFLSVTSTPAGASVYIDGTYQGITPLDVKVNAGQHSIRLSLNGYFDTTYDLMIMCEKRYTKNYSLTPVPITITPTPAYITCPAPCECLSPREATVRWVSGSSQCSESPCGKTIPMGDTLPAIKYCFQQKTGIKVVQPPQPVTVIPVMADPCIVAGKTKCDGNCVDVQTDHANCGTCGNQCRMGSSCKAGACSPPKIVAVTDKCKTVGKTNCNGNCVNITSDVFNCGACGVTCSQGSGCQNGVCTWAQSDAITGSVSPSTINCITSDIALKFTGTANVPVGTPVYLKIFDAQSSSPNALPWDGVLIGSARIRTDTSYEYVWNGVIPGYKLKGGQDYLVKTMLSDSLYVQQIIHYTCADCGASCAPTETCAEGKCVSLCSVRLSTLTSFSWADWQGKNWLTSVKNQGSCGSCWAEAPTGTTEAVYNLETGYQNNVDISEQAIVSGCFGDMGSCTGGWNDLALGSLQSIGIPEESAMPYMSGSCGLHFEPPGSRNAVCNADCNQNNSNLHCSIPNTCNLGMLPSDTKIWKIQSYRKENPDLGGYKKKIDKDFEKEFNSIKQALLCNGPLSVCSGRWWHCVTLVGWRGDIRDPDGGWVIKNSWGDTWNGNGYGFIPYGDPWSTQEDNYNDILLDAWSVKGVNHVP